ncbi:MAG: glycosyltransferase family 1 protein [Bacteroidota bacterium]
MINRIKIFVDGHVFDKEFQGTQTFLRELYTRLLADYPVLDIYFGACDIANIKRIFPGLPATNLLPYKKRKFGGLRLLFDIPFYLKQQQFHFAHFQYISPMPVSGCKYIVTLHDLLFKDFKGSFPFFYRKSRSLLFGLSIKVADIKTTISQYSKARICYHYSLPASEIHVIGNGAGHSGRLFKTSKETARNYVNEHFGLHNFILYVSRIEPRKNHLLLLQSYLNLKLYQQKIALVFVGKESVEVPELKWIVNNLNYEQRRYFYWIEQLDATALTHFYRACRFFVYPSMAEGFGIPPLEAALCNSPVLCSSATAMHDFDFFEPFTFDPSNVVAFEEKLRLMVKSPPSESFIQGVAAQITQRYSWQQSSKQFYQLLRKWL